MTIAEAAPTWLALSAEIIRRMPAAKYRAMSWICKRPTPQFVAEMPGSCAGLRFECDLRNALAREVFFTGQYEPQETALLRALLEPGHTFVDVGAHWGYFSFLAAEAVGLTGRVIAVEADPRIHRTLERNAALNGLARLTVVFAAAAAEQGTLTLAGFSEEQDNWGISRVLPAHSAGRGGTFEVPARPVDDLLDELGVAEVDVLKMDIEGAEALAVRGMATGLRAHRYRRILLEIHPAQIRDHGTTARDVIDGLFGAGYRGFAVDHSPAATRRAAYESGTSLAELVRPLDRSALLDDWPHVLWIAPGTDDPAFIR